eukprot:TRINITY_DN3407_c0_g5_i1.p2 TRINITY_DN3407_c0_g5~~TRINITY_DN3407_c0_g5_i1.p2  ORF type:complete len:157 (-),score=40.56 TRINITY_DN3407_c0_g5_i1:177-647(-)
MAFALVRSAFSRALSNTTLPLVNCPEFVRFATNRSAGVTKNGRDSQPKYLGVKKYGDEYVIPGNIIIRQRGVKFSAGEGVGMGKDHTIFALKNGYVRFSPDPFKPKKKMVSIIDEKQNVPKLKPVVAIPKSVVDEIAKEVTASQQPTRSAYRIMKH